MLSPSLFGSLSCVLQTGLPGFCKSRGGRAGCLRRPGARGGDCRPQTPSAAAASFLDPPPPSTPGLPPAPPTGVSEASTAGWDVTPPWPPAPPVPVAASGGTVDVPPWPDLPPAPPGFPPADVVWPPAPPGFPPADVVVGCPPWPPLPPGFPPAAIVVVCPPLPPAPPCVCPPLPPDVAVDPPLLELHAPNRTTIAIARQFAQANILKFMYAPLPKGGYHRSTGRKENKHRRGVLSAVGTCCMKARKVCPQGLRRVRRAEPLQERRKLALSRYDCHPFEFHKPSGSTDRGLGKDQRYLSAKLFVEHSSYL